jgi:isopenicillin-N N-acyltransferase-like protein
MVRWDAVGGVQGWGGGEDFLTRLLIRWTRLLAGHRVVLSIVLGLMAVVFSALSAGIVWQADILQFFSAKSADIRNVRAAGETSGLANYLRFDVHWDSAAASSSAPEILGAITRELARSLNATGEFRKVWTGAEATDLARTYATLLAHAPEILTDEDRAKAQQHAAPAAVLRHFSEVHAKLADPDGEFLLQELRADPLDLGSIVSAKLQSLSPTGKLAGAINAPTMDNGVLTTRDAGGALHTMIVGEPISLPSNQRAAERTLNATNAAIAALKVRHPGIGVWVVGAHRGYVENAHRVMSDVTGVSLMGTLLVAVAIALYFRRVSTALLCIIPASVGLGVALGLAGVLHVTLPLILLGFAGLLCGSTTDYGIQIIAECRRLSVLLKQRGATSWDGDLPAIAARRLFGPISMSVATSVTGFAALGLSDAPGLRALGLFVAAATLCIWGVTFLILPAYLGPWVLPKSDRTPKTQMCVPRVARRWLYVGACILFLTVTLIFGASALHVRFNTDARSMDGSSAALLADEQSFFAVWGEMRNRAIVIVNGSSAEQTLTDFAKVDAYMRDLQREGLVVAVTSPGSVLPDQPTATRRIAAWNALWTPAEQTSLRQSLADAAAANGFKPAGFTAYADRVGKASTDTSTERLTQSPAALFPGFISLASDGRPNNSLAILVDLRTDRSLRLATGWAQELRLRYPDAAVLSGQILIFDATERARAEAERLGPWCLLAILAPLWIYFRRLKKAWLAMLCLGVGFVWVLGAAQLFAGGLNLLSLVPILFTLGVAVDYGVYAASDPAWQSTDSTASGGNRLAATFMCALTTLLGSGSLQIAIHPALRWLGITLVAGISGGYLTSLFIVAPLARWSSQQSKRHSQITRRVGRWLLTIGVALITILLLIPPLTQLILDWEHPSGMTAPSHFARAEEIGPRTYTFGRSWMRWRKTSPSTGLWEIAAVGSPSERGTALAALASPIDVRIENEMPDQLDYFLPQEWSRWLLLRTVAANLITLPHYIKPEYQQEIFAAATSYDDPHAYLAPSYPRILSYHALHDISQMLIDNPLIVPNTFACTGIVSLPAYTSSTPGGHLLLARVFDFEGGESFGRQKSITYIIPPPGEGIPFAHVAWPGLAGVVTGMNQEKIALFLNAAATRDFRRIGTPTILMARDILEHARSLNEAERIIRVTEVFVSDIVVVADGKTGEARIFEKSPAHTAAYAVDASAVVTNHLVTPTFADDPVNTERKTDGTTLQRYGRARQLLDQLKNEVTIPALAELLRDKRGLNDADIGYGNRNAVDGLIACHAVVMDVTSGQMWVAAWPNAEGQFVGVDVMAMLKNAAANPTVAAAASPPEIPEATILGDGTWDRIVAARASADQAETALRAGDFVKARALAEAVVRDNPNFYLGHELRGRALFAAGDRAAARVELTAALALDPPYSARRTAIQGLLKQCDTH